MMKSMMAVATSCVLLTSGCAAPPMKQDATAPKAQSEVLGKAFADTLAEWVVQMKESGGTLPPEATKTDFVGRSMEIAKGAFPSLFLVSATEEADFQVGRFQDETNKKRMLQSIQRLSDYGVVLPIMSGLLISKFKAGNLEGAQLELAARLLSAQVEHVGAIAKDKNAEPEN